jgi:hypothetical protein
LYVLSLNEATMSTLTKTGMALVAPEVAAAAVAVDLVKHGVDTGITSAGAHMANRNERTALDLDVERMLVENDPSAAAVVAESKVAISHDNLEQDKNKTKRRLGLGLIAAGTVLTLIPVTAFTAYKFITKTTDHEANAIKGIIAGAAPTPSYEMQVQSILQSLHLSGDVPLVGGSGESSAITDTGSHVSKIPTSKLFNSHTGITTTSDLNLLLTKDNSADPTGEVLHVEPVHDPAMPPNEGWHIRATADVNDLAVQPSNEAVQLNGISIGSGRGSKLAAFFGDDQKTAKKVEVTVNMADRNFARQCGQTLLGLASEGAAARVDDYLRVAQDVNLSIDKVLTPDTSATSLAPVTGAETLRVAVNEKTEVPDKQAIITQLLTNKVEVVWTRQTSTLGVTEIVQPDQLPLPVPDYYTREEVAKEIGQDVKDVHIEQDEHSKNGCLLSGDATSKFSKIIHDSRVAEAKDALDPAAANVGKELATTGAGN